MMHERGKFIGSKEPEMNYDNMDNLELRRYIGSLYRNIGHLGFLITKAEAEEKRRQEK